MLMLHVLYYLRYTSCQPFRVDNSKDSSHGKILLLVAERTSPWNQSLRALTCFRQSDTHCITFSPSNSLSSWINQSTYYVFYIDESQTHRYIISKSMNRKPTNILSLNHKGHIQPHTKNPSLSQQRLTPLTPSRHLPTPKFPLDSSSAHYRAQDILSSSAKKHHSMHESHPR